MRQHYQAHRRRSGLRYLKLYCLPQRTQIEMDRHNASQGLRQYLVRRCHDIDVHRIDFQGQDQVRLQHCLRWYPLKFAVGLHCRAVHPHRRLR